jgi:photosystem II stability/assembly factor-like uncharacterized protein
LLQRSVDGGKTWKQVEALVYGTSYSLQKYGFLAYGPKDPATVFVEAHIPGSKFEDPRSGQTGLFVSHDAGNTFSFLVGNIDSLTFAISESRPETMYVATFHEYLLKSNDGGTLWQFVGPGKQNVADCGSSSGRIKEEITSIRWIHQVLIHPRNPLLVYAATDDGIWMTEDGGSHWCLIKLAPDVKSVGELVVATDRTEEVIFAGSNAGLFISRDSGKTWSRQNLIR